MKGTERSLSEFADDAKPGGSVDLLEDLLQQYRAASVKLDNVTKDLDLQLQSLNTPEMQKKKLELAEQEKNLKLIEQELGMTPSDKTTESILEPIMLGMCDTPIPAKRMRREIIKKWWSPEQWIPPQNLMELHERERHRLMGLAENSYVLKI